QHRPRQRAAGPLGPPVEPLVVDDRTEPVRAVRLPPRARVGADRAAVQRETVPGAVPRAGLPPPPPLPPCVTLQRVGDAVALERHTAGLWCPHLELHGRFPFVCSP